MATRAAIAGAGAAALVTLGLAAAFAHAQTSAPPRLGDTVRVSPASSGPTVSRSARPSPERTVRPVAPPRPPDSDDDDDDADDD
ncbi:MULTISPECIES: small secreted hydrophilic protein [Actinomadura]|jgi:hypothetical protein|uniref:Small secreted hydrophilic protein n=1 Tax=Actinomadura geliboluensis TaxID=882440 RepID=A0A5S4FQ84_9ACTN|nr:small secreted hydrophilic protein [Actinomadura geliboluensis]TMR22862.1 small secreted hydrophilic protein [Actinomadura geliboluensis]